MQKMTYAMTVAGFDGSAGAGILADIKAMKDFGVYGTAVCTALTLQNESSFSEPGFLPWERICAQLEKLYEVRTYRFVKIGLVENAETLRRIVEWLRCRDEKTFIVWDPIMGATAGYRFFADGDADSFFPVFSQIDLITPNQFEYAYLGLGVADSRREVFVGNGTSVLLKGGHAKGDLSVDILWHDGKKFEFASRRLPGVDKHGSGCTLSAAILANVAMGKSLPESCSSAKDYIAKWFAGGEGRIGWVK